MNHSILTTRIMEALGAGRKALIPFLPAGFPDKDRFFDELDALDAGGADVIEIGVPFSDPVADGPVVEKATLECLARGSCLSWLLGELAGSDALAVAATREALTAQLVTACDRFGVRIVAVCEDAAGRRLAEMFGVGATDPDEAAVAVVRPAPAPEAPLARGRILTVWGPAGAPGRTTIAIELACELARDGRRVALVDADAHAPSIAMLTGLPDEVRLVCLEPVLGVAVLPGEHRDGARSQLEGRPECANGDLTAVRDQDLTEHLHLFPECLSVITA